MVQWLPIEKASKVSGVEIIGTRWAFQDGKAVCIREPFISFWSPSLHKFYCDPTHFILSPGPPTTPRLLNYAKACDALLDIADTAAVDGDYEHAIHTLVAAFHAHIAETEDLGLSEASSDGGS